MSFTRNGTLEPNDGRSPDRPKQERPATAAERAARLAEAKAKAGAAKRRGQSDHDTRG